MSSELEKTHKNAWIASFVAHGVLVKQIDEELEAAGCIPLDDYEVLLTLEEAPDRRLRMSELADQVLVSRSGVTRLVDRLEKKGLLRREACPNDRRACHATLTDAGLAERERAWPVYRAAIAAHFAKNLNDEEAQVVARVFRRMVGDRELVGQE
ncbi:MAG: MarR family winged helix-turn-helix transcriptional regulator [Fimbriimonas sp.]